ncbi:hypothetical protein ACVWWR_000132 [Bradyrhizobium sp. LM3.2]
MIGAVDRGARHHDQPAAGRKTSKPFEQTRRARHGPRKILERARNRQPDRRPAGQMEDVRRQAVQGGECIQIGRIDFTIDPALQAESVRIGRIERTVTNAMDHTPGARQLANEMTSDESVRTGNPRGHYATLGTANETLAWLASKLLSVLPYAPSSLARRQFPDDGRRITCYDRICRNILGDHSPRGDNPTLTNGHASHNHGASTDPRIIANLDRTVVKRKLPWVTGRENLLRLFVPLRGTDRMREIVEYVDGMRDQDTISDVDRRT